jgi:hypothetical protein
MHEFVSAGGELIIHTALHIKNSPTPQLLNAAHLIFIFFSFNSLYLLGPKET